MPQRLTRGPTLAQIRRRYRQAVYQSQQRDLRYELMVAEFEAIAHQREMQRQSCQASLPTTITIIKVYPNAF